MSKHPLIRNAGIGSLLALILVGCGGGSDESTPAVTASTISGVVSKGPISGANVCAYSITGGAKGSLVGTCQTTGANGNYTLDLGGYTGDVLFEASGGSYVDEATGVTVNLASPLRGMLTGVTGGQATAAITALTELAYQMANSSVGNLTATNIQNAVVRVQNNFGVTDIVTTLPVDALSVPAQATATQKSYALALATVSQYLKGQPTGTSLTNALQTMQACLSASTSCAALGSELNTATSTFQAAHAAFSGLTTPIVNFGSVAGSSAPTIANFYPKTGAAGVAVYITGSKLNLFTPSPLVKFGTTTATVTSTSYLGGVQITVNVPTGLPAGDNAITISNGDGTGMQNVGTFNVTAAGGGSGAGLTFTPSLGVTASMPDTRATFTLTGQVLRGSWGNSSDNVQLSIGYSATVGSLTLAMTIISPLSTAIMDDPNGGCLLVAVSGSNIPTCASKGVVFDKAAGIVTFTNSPMKASYGTVSPFTMTGSLSFTPF